MLTLQDLLTQYNLATGEPFETILQIVPPDCEIDHAVDTSDDTEIGVYANVPQTTVQKDLALVAGISARLAAGALQLGFHKSQTKSSVGLLFGSFSIWIDTHTLDSSSTAASPVCLCEWAGHLSVDQDWHVTVTGDLTVTQQQFSFRQGQVLVTVNQIKAEGLPSAIPAAATQFFDQAAFLSIEADVVANTFFDVPALPGWRIGFGDGQSSPAVSVVAILADDPGVFASAALCLEPPASDLTPMVKTGNTWTEALDKDGAKRPVRILVTGGAVAWSASRGFGVFGSPQLTIDPFQIGNTGVIVACTGLHVCLTDQDPVPIYVPANSRGFAIDSVGVALPPSMTGVPNDIVGTDLFLGTGGFTGKLTGNWAAGTPIQMGGIECQLKSLSLEFKQNSLVGSALACELTVPFFDQPVNLDVSLSGDGTLLATLSASQQTAVTYDNGLIHFEKTGVFKVSLEGLSFEEKHGISKLSLSGQLTPTIPGIAWPTFEIRELSIDSNGRVYVDGGFSALPKSYSIDVHGAKLEITKFGLGTTDDGGRYIAMSGAVELVKGMPAGASVEGLRLVWYDDGRPTSLSFNGIGITFETPALSFDGHVSYTDAGGDHQFKGDLTVVIPAANDLTLIGKAVFGSKNGMKYFAIYIEGEFGTGLPLGATGLAMYGIAGLLAVNYAPDKPGTMLWYSVDHANSFFHKPQTGVTDIVRKWKPESGTFAIGAGIGMGTLTDGGYAFNGKFLLLLLLPGPVLMIDGSAAVLRSLSDKSEPPFHGLIVWDNRAGYFMVGLDARWKKDPQQGDVADISGSMEAFFNFHDPRLWHLWLGKDHPVAQRIQARFAKAFTANAYFMLDASQLAVGVWIGTSEHYNWGPVGADLEAWMAADAIVNFKPSQFHANIEFYGHFAIKVFKFHLAIGMDATLSADVAKPFHIKGALDIAIETRIKDFHIHMELEWGPRIDPPDMHVPELAPVQSWGITHSKSSNEWPLVNPLANPVVPVDSLPYFTFAFPMHDLHGIGVNSTVPTPEWTMIGDPTKPPGAAQAKFSLTGITLYRVDGNVGSQTQTAIAAHPKPANAAADFGDIYGVWAPSVPGTSGGQNKLMLWSANPLDFADKTASWNPWLSSNLQGYPCPDTKPETICMDFEDLDLGKQLYGSGWHTQNLDFKLAWSDAGPHPIMAAPGQTAVQVLDRGLFFPTAMPRKTYRTYVANFGDNTVSVLDLVTHQVTATIKVGAHPRQVVGSRNGKYAYVCNQDDDTVIAIDTVTNQHVGAPVTVIKSPDSITITPDGKRAFVPSGIDSTMSVIDLQSLQVTTVKLPAVANHVILSLDETKLYVTHGPAGNISVLAANSFALLKTVLAKGGPDTMIIHPSVARAWISFPSLGTVRLFDTGRDEFTALETQTGAWARDLALSVDGARLYVGNLQDNTVSVLNTNTLDVVATIKSPSPVGLQITPDGAALLVANYFSNTITTIDLDRSGLDRNQIVEQSIATGKGSDSFAVVEAQHLTLGRALVCDERGNALTALDMKTRQRVASIKVGRAPRFVALTVDGRMALVGNGGDGMLMAFDPTTLASVRKPVSLGLGLSSSAFSPDGKLAYVSSTVDPTMWRIDLSNLTVADVLKLVSPAPCVLLSRDYRKGYLVQSNGTISVFSISKLHVVKVVPVPERAVPLYMALHPSLSFAFVSFPLEGSVREFDTEADKYTGRIVPTGKSPQNLCYSPDGARLYVCNFLDSTVSVVDTAAAKLVVTIPVAGGPMSPVCLEDGSILVITNYSGEVTIIDAVKNSVIGSPIPNQGAPSSVVLAGAGMQGGGLAPVPVEVTIDVPAGSSSVEVTWAGVGPLHGTVSLPSSQATEAVAVSGSKLKLDVALLGPTGAGLALSGIDQIRLHCDSAWTLLRVCVTRLPFAGGLAAQQILHSAFQQQVDVWKNPTFLLDPGQEYKVHLEWEVSVQGLNDLANWSESFTGAKDLTFTTALPPSLGTVSDPNVPPKIPSTVKGLDDLSLYVRTTIPVTQTPNDQIAVLTKPVFCGYDVTVEFNESYVDQLYQMAGRDLDLLLFDRNNEPVRDASGQLIIVEDAWANAPTLTLTDTQALWIDMFNANTCGLQQINPATIPTSKVLRANDAHVLAADSVYEARLVPQLMHQTQIVAASWTAEPFAAGAQIFNPGSSPAWTDYRVSVLVTLTTSDPVGILFGYTSNAYYEFTIDPGGNRRRLTQVSGGTATTIREDYCACHPGQDDPYRIRIEAVGSQILISQNGAVVFTLTGAASLTGTVGLRQPATQAVFTDLGVSDLSAAAPIAYRFHFTTSKFTNFYHQIHSFQDQLWAKDWMTPLDLSAAVSSLPTGELPSAPPAQTVTDMEVRAYDDLASQVLGSASAQDPPQVEVTRLEHENAIFGWLVRSPEPVDYTRVQITLTAAPRILARGQAPGAVKITEAELGDVESVTVLAREAIDLTGYRVEYRQLPSALADALGSRNLGQGDGSSIAGDQTWTDYRASVVCRSKVTGGIGIQFRYVDAQNFYAFTYDFTTGLQTIVRTVNGVSTDLNSTSGDPAPGNPDAPPVTLTVSVLGPQIACYRAGQKVLQVSDSAFPLGGAGAFSAGNSSAQFDSFEVHRLPNESYALLQGHFSTSTISGWLAATDGSGLELNVIDPSTWTNAILRVRMRRNAFGTIGLLLRYQDPNNHYRLLFTNTERRLERVVGGVVALLWSSALTTAVNRSNEFVVSLLDTTLSVCQNSVLACEVTDASFTSGSIGLCKGPGADFVVSQLVLYPPEFAFSDWTVQDDFQALSADTWTLVDEGDQGGPSNWQVANGRLTQTSAILDSTPDPIGQRGTIALNKDANPVDSRLVTRLLSDQAGAIGVVFGYQDANNFWRLSMNASANVSAQYRRLVSCVNGKMTVLWADSVAFDSGREYVLTLDLIDDYVTAWLDGEKLFQCRLSGAVIGAFGLYCCGNAGASFGNFRVGTAAWNHYYTFGRELPLSAGNRVKIASAVAVAPNRRTSMRLATELDDTAFNRLPPAGMHLRVVAPDQAVQHGREFIPTQEYSKILFRALRKADGTGIFLARVGSMAPGQTLEMSFLYRRDNGTVAFTEVGESGDEVVSIDLPTASENSILLSRLRIPQLVDGGNWKTTIVLANTDSVPAQFTATFHQADGTPLALPLAGGGAVTQHSGIIPVGGSRTIETEGQASNLVQGWAEVVTASAISGTAVFRQSIGTAVSEGTVQVRASGAMHFLLPFDNTQGLVTAAAVLNPDPMDTATVSVIFRDGNGQLISNEALTLAANSRQVIALPTQFPAVANKRGVAEFLSDKLEISLLGLRFTSTGAFTSLEPILVDAVSVAGSSASIAQVADGAGWQTSIILVNTGSAPAPFSVTFTQPGGIPWSLPVTLADGALLTDAIPAGGSRIIETSGLATVLSQGWGQVVTSGSIAGTTILRQTLNTGQDTETAVPLSLIKMRRFVLPFNNTQGFVTAVAVANQDASQATVVSVILRDLDGKLLGDGAINLGPLAQSAFVLPTQFPVTANVQGLAECSAANADISALGLRVNPQGSFTSILPIGK